MNTPPFCEYDLAVFFRLARELEKSAWEKELDRMERMNADTFLDAIMEANSKNDRKEREASMLAFADWLREHGGQPDTAYAWEWLVRRNKFPRISAQGRNASFERESYRDARLKKKKNPAWIPAPLYDVMNIQKHSRMSLRECLIRLSMALLALRKAAAFNPDAL